MALDSPAWPIGANARHERSSPYEGCSVLTGMLATVQHESAAASRWFSRP